MLRTLVSLFDGTLLRSLAQRAVLSVIALGAAAIGMVFLIASIWQALALWLGPLFASLISMAGFMLMASALFAFASFRWRKRPRPLLTRARYGVVAEGLRLAQTVLRNEPSKAILAALILGAITEQLSKRDRS